MGHWLREATVAAAHPVSSPGSMTWTSGPRWARWPRAASPGCSRRAARASTASSLRPAFDEICLTLSPRLVSGDAKRILAGPSLPGGQQWRLRSLCEQDGFLFLRWRPA